MCSRWGVKPVGGDEAFARGSVYSHRVKHLANVGFPLDPQLTRSIRPDLIILASPDEQVYRSVAGIAPSLTFDSFAPLEQRLRILGEWLGKQREAAVWLQAYHAKKTPPCGSVCTPGGSGQVKQLRRYSMTMATIYTPWE
ncbi:hypothetical protein ACFTAO_05240 [Paenibacillus rhizoplanae]